MILMAINNKKQICYHLCSTVIGSFFLNFVKIFNKIKEGIGSGLKICGHTNLKFIIDTAIHICFFNGHVCAQHKTKEQGRV